MTKKLLFLPALLIGLTGWAQAPPYVHYQQMQSMHLTPTNSNRKVYSWVTDDSVKHSKTFYIGQKFIEPDYKGIVRTIYEINEEGAWFSCKNNQCDGYAAYEYLIHMNFINPKKKKTK